MKKERYFLMMGLLLLALLAIAFAPIGVEMATGQDIAKILGRDLSPQEQQALRDYLSQVDSIAQNFTGGNTLEIDRIEARTGKFVFPPLEAARWDAVAQANIDDTGVAVSWTAEVENNGVMEWDSSDPTKLYFPTGSTNIDKIYLVTLSMWDNSGDERKMSGTLHFYDIDDGITSSGLIFQDVTARCVSMTAPLWATSGDIYVIVNAWSDVSDTFSFRLSIVRVR
jgi:hypothetical protein